MTTLIGGEEEREEGLNPESFEQTRPTNNKKYNYHYNYHYIEKSSPSVAGWALDDTLPTMGMESPDPLGSNLKPHLNILLTFQIILRDLDLIRG